MASGLLLWTEDDGWRCEVRAGPAGTTRLEVYQGDRLVTSETRFSVVSLLIAVSSCGKRVLRGDLRSTPLMGVDEVDTEF